MQLPVCDVDCWRQRRDLASRRPARPSDATCPQGFLRALGPGGEGALNGFPPAKDITSVGALAKIVAQVG